MKTVTRPARHLRVIGVGGILRRPYLVASVLLFVVLLLTALSGGWYGDFWEHAAVVRELSARPLAPSHPQLLLDAPHAFYSPYALVVALGARLFDAGPITALAVAGLGNLMLFLIGLRAFAASVSHRSQERLAFYTLLLMLFWWGPNPWRWSGFFHIGVIGFVVPYPSTCALAIALLSLALYRHRRPRLAAWHHLLLVLATAFVLLSHPYTFIFLVAGYAGMALGATTNRSRELIRVTAVIVGGVLIALPWPYFPLLELLLNQHSEYHPAQISLYAIVRAWPVLVLLVLLVFARLPRRMLGPVITLALLTGLYLYGALTQQWAYGRLIGTIALMVFLLAAERLVALEARVRDRWSGRMALVVPLVVILVSVALSWRPTLVTLAHVIPPWVSDHRDYDIVEAVVDEHAVVMATLADAWLVPAFGGRIVASRHTLAFVPDHDDRRLDVARFFDPASSPAIRRDLIEKYGIEFVLVRNAATPRLPDTSELQISEDPVARNSTLSLHRVRRAARRPTPAHELR